MKDLIEELRQQLNDVYGFELPKERAALAAALEVELRDPPRNCESLLRELYELVT